MQAQEHFAGIATSQNTGILNGSVNPAEFANIQSTYSFNAISLSAYISNNKIGFSDLISSNNFEEAIFSGNKPASIRADFEILGPSFTYKMDKWAFTFMTSAKTKANIVDINNDLGNAIVNGSTPESIETATAVLVDYNQKATATTWGEIGFGVAREVFNFDGHTINAGATFKILFPGTYARMSASNFDGTITTETGNIALTDASSNVQFAYSGSLADNFSDVGNFTDYFGNGPSGFSMDFGVNYNWKATDDNRRLINAGAAFRNIGTMTFKDSNNQSNSYILNVPQGQFLDLEQFSGDTSIQNIEQKLIQSGFAQIAKENTDFKVKLPTTFSIYADVRIFNNWFLGAFTQQKLNQDYEETQIAVQNIFTVTPRYATDTFEVYLPLSTTEISGFAAGIGARYRGFYIGSGSFITAVLNNGDTHQADAYLGFRFSL
jgi:hypothetical protein